MDAVLKEWKVLVLDPRTQDTAVTVSISAIGWTLLHLVCHALLRPWFLRLLERNPAMAGNKAKKEAAAAQMMPRVVCFVHNVIQIPLALMILADPAFEARPLYHTTGLSRTVMAISAGYFLYDTIDVTMHLEREGAEFLLHAVFCFLVYANLLRTGLLHFFGAGYLLWEMSTPFMHFRWFLYKIGTGNSKLYSANAFIGMLVFFACRNFWGLYLSVRFWQATAAAMQTDEGRQRLDPTLMLLFRVALFALNGLNAYWASKMIQILYKMLVPGKAADPNELLRVSSSVGRTAKSGSSNSKHTPLPQPSKDSGAPSLVKAVDKKAQ